MAKTTNAAARRKNANAGLGMVGGAAAGAATGALFGPMGAAVGGARRRGRRRQSRRESEAVRGECQINGANCQEDGPIGVVGRLARRQVSEEETDAE